MKEYYGYPISGETPARVGYRVRGESPVTLILHTNSAKHSTFDWGVESLPSTNLSRSLLLDAFGTERCGNAPNKCRCTNKWVTDRVINKFHENITVKRFTNKDIFKISQADICNFAFDVLMEPEQEEEVNLDIELGDLKVKEPELI